MTLPRKDNGKLDWKVLIIGKDWKSFLVWTMLTIAILLMAYGYKNDNKQFLEVYENPCAYCSDCNQMKLVSDFKLNGIPEGTEVYQQPNEKKEDNKTGGS